MGPQRTMKKQNKHNGPVIVFDAAACREFVQGFSKRKEERRKAALAQQALKEKEEKRRLRQQKRDALKRQIYELESARLQASKAAAAEADQPRAAGYSRKAVKAGCLKDRRQSPKGSSAPAFLCSSNSEAPVIEEDGHRRGNSAERVLQHEHILPPPLYHNASLPPSSSSTTAAVSDTGIAADFPTNSEPSQSSAALPAAQHAPWLIGGVVKVTFGGF